ncbi:hypothetical protein AVEN_110648-1 [Araneus ventricosus]|uniref:Uncharacterized protein n=1 Tax=Araneus ventricosus TaxID=182803 RepID=A0A4Y2ATH9_ARAVE|nr:hypothetical protein AVEN_110648-1 [Araneus ventricosus]
MAIQNSNLPPCFVNEVVKIVEDETIVRSNFKSFSDVYSWIEKYGRTLDTKLNLRSSRPSRTKLVCCYKYQTREKQNEIRLRSRCNLEPNIPSSRNDLRVKGGSPRKLQDTKEHFFSDIVFRPHGHTGQNRTFVGKYYVCVPVFAHITASPHLPDNKHLGKLDTRFP